MSITCGLTGHPTSPRHGPSYCRSSSLSWVARRRLLSHNSSRLGDAGAFSCFRSAVCCTDGGWPAASVREQEDGGLSLLRGLPADAL